jgi:hypothetical protein
MQHIIFKEKKEENSHDRNQKKFDNIIKTLDEIQQRLDNLVDQLEKVNNKK